MPNFWKNIEIQEKTLYCSFTRVYTEDGTFYYISIPYGQQTLYLSMRHRKGRWFLDNPGNCPSWIARLEQDFSHAITSRDHVHFTFWKGMFG